MINCMKKCVVNDNLIATGGKENDLKLWNLENESNNAYFKSKNVNKYFFFIKLFTIFYLGL